MEAVHRRQLITPHLALENIRRWQQVLADALAQNLAIGLRAAVADHLWRVPVRADLTTSRRAARLHPGPRARTPQTIRPTIAGKAWMRRRRHRVGGMLTECRGSTRSRR